MRRMLVSIALSVLVLASMAEASAAAAVSGRVTIDVHTVFGEDGTFVATGGVVCESGTTTDLRVVIGDEGRILTFDVLKKFTCADGSATFHAPHPGEGPAVRAGQSRALEGREWDRRLRAAARVRRAGGEVLPRQLLHQRGDRRPPSGSVDALNRVTRAD